MMYGKNEKYDPAIYGQLRAKFLRELDAQLDSTDSAQEEEQRRQDVIKEIKEKKLVIIK